MKNLKFLGFALNVAILSCALETAQAGPADLQFSQVVDDFVFGTLALSPVTASTVGYHKHHGEILEDKLDDFSAAGFNSSINFLRDIEERTPNLDPKALSPDHPTTTPPIPAPIPPP